jgi:hypothetical protein
MTSTAYTKDWERDDMIWTVCVLNDKSRSSIYNMLVLQKKTNPNEHGYGHCLFVLLYKTR